MCLFTSFKTVFKNISSKSVFKKDDIWTSAIDFDIKCISTGGKCIYKIKTQSRRLSNDIAITNLGNEVYCDWK